MFGDCYESRTEFQDPVEVNLFHLCLFEDLASARMIFENKGSLPAVCHQYGKVESTTDATVSVSLAQGYCDNGRSFAADRMQCVSLDDKRLSCEGPQGANLLEFVGSYQ